ncbi:hypothetical protein NML43_16135 [Rhodopseudomonas palustris]|uniref:hypothetical protein n=1 Tax=Rhodopseudomonas palustris TaxID=1076 RepID=UPI0020CC072E|nr:hypothetical protein [Rhodopseudomonas palustris]MCP9628623.1 hypothetical protein [Rhodopseudomonas palustris]
MRLDLVMCADDEQPRDGRVPSTAKSPPSRRIAVKALGQIRKRDLEGKQRLPYTVTAIRNDEKMQSVRSSALIALAKARVWESEGWRVAIVDPDGREHDVAQLDELTSFKPEKLTALSALLTNGELSRTTKDAAVSEAAADRALQPQDIHGPWRAEPHGPWLTDARGKEAEKALALASS